MPEVSSGQNIGGIINPPPIGGESNQIQISLLAFDKLVRIGVTGEVSSAPYIPAFEKWDAVAKCDIPLNSLRNMFVFQTDHFDVDDLNPQDVRFYVDASQIPNSINLASSVVGNGAVISVNAINQPLSSSDMVIGKDYVKHLANILFGYKIYSLINPVKKNPGNAPGLPRVTPFILPLIQVFAKISVLLFNCHFVLGPAIKKSDK
jgi:hypothetical protein